MRKMTVDDMNFKGKHVVLRVDYNVPMQDGTITDDTRITATLPTLRKLIDDGASIVILSHLGRPKSKNDKEFSLKPVSAKLAELLGRKVDFLTDCVGDAIFKKTAAAKPGDIIMLENVRFYAEEEKNEVEFAKKLAKHGDVYVNDAFAVSHRAHASVEAITKFLSPSVAGYLMGEELNHLQRLINDPPQPFIAVVGGAKVSTKIGVLENLLPKVDKLLIGGGMMFTFMANLGMEVGNSIVEKDSMNTAMELWLKSEELGGRIQLPVDVVVTQEIEEDSPVKLVGYDGIPKKWCGVDIGKSTARMYADYISQAKAVFLNGPMGIFENPKFAEGTVAVLEAMRELNERGGIAVVGGGDSAAAANQLGFGDCMTHISTGGGASLELMEGRKLPGIEALTNFD